MNTSVIRKNIYIILGFGISIICLFFAFRGIQWAQLASIYEKASFFGLILSLLFQLLTLSIAGFRWKVVINLPKVSWASASASMMVGLMVNNVLPGRMGEFVRPVVLGQEIKESKAFLFATVVIDRMLDLLVLVPLGLLSFGMFPFIPWAHQVSKVGGLVIILVFIVIGTFGYSGVGHKIERILDPLIPIRFNEMKAHFFKKFKQGFRSIGSIRRGAMVLGLSWFLWATWFLSLYYALNAFNLILPIWGMILLLAALNLGSLIPSSPGYAGTYHFLAVAVLSTFAIKKEEALSFILLFHALWYLTQTFLGIGVLIKKNISLWQLIKR